MVSSFILSLSRLKSPSSGVLRILCRGLSGVRTRNPRPGPFSYLSVPGEEPLLSTTIGQLIDDAGEKFGDNEAIVVNYQNIRKTFAQTKKEIDELAEGFLRIGLEKGDRVGIWSPNRYEWYLTHNAVAKAGLVLVSINPAYQGPELSFAINRVGIKCLIIAPPFKTQDYYAILNSISPEVEKSDPGKINSKSTPSLKSVITMQQQPLKGTYTFEEVMDKGRKNGTQLIDQMKKQIEFDDLFNIQFTSGTTGQPKGVMLSHHNLVNNSYLVGKRLLLNSKDKIVLTVPLFHCYGSVGGILNTIHRGSTLVFPAPSFEPLASVQAISEEKCTVLYGTPTMHVDMTGLPNLSEFDLSSLRVACTAGASAPGSLCQLMKTTYGINGVISLYGMTETSPVSFQNLYDDPDELRNTTVGYPLEHTEVKVIDPEGKIVPVGTEGEMCIRGYLNMSGYWDEPEKTKQVIDPARWLHTGDIMIMYENGYARVSGRLSDMIIRGGENIYPKEIEEHLHSHPKIMEAHVFGVSDDRMGEELGVWIRLKDGETMDAAELKTFSKGKIAHFKVPRYIYFRSDFPKTTSGKIQKFKMREIVEKELGKSKS
jgi:fatty-acyl-CoA synthase